MSVILKTTLIKHWHYKEEFDADHFYVNYYYYLVYLFVIIFVTILLSFVVVLCGTCFILYFFGGGGVVGGGSQVWDINFVRTVLWPLAPYFFSRVTRKS